MTTEGEAQIEMEGASGSGAGTEDLSAEADRLRGQNAALRQRLCELEDHNRSLTQAATERARLVQERDTELAEIRQQIATSVPETDRLRGENAALKQRNAELEKHNEVLTEAATERARQLQEKRQAEWETDHQIRIVYQQIVTGMKDAEPKFIELYEKCRPYTMTSIERLYALYKSVEYIVSAKIPGDFAETGVWRGGSCMMIAETLLAVGDSSRRIFLFDTFTGHPRPDAETDVDLWGNRAVDEWERLVGEDGHGRWGDVPLEEVQTNLALTGYPIEKLVFVKGRVEDTARDFGSIGTLALLRLDTDWYSSTKAALEHFYPSVGGGGVLIIDDYGYFKGARRATDEYFRCAAEPILLNRIDFTCRLGVKRRRA